MTASRFIPDERLFRPDADIFLYFLSSPGVISTEPNEDKWFRTTFNIGDLILNGGDGRESGLYAPDVPASPLACAEQYQFCNANQDQCGPLASKNDAFSRAAPLFGTTSEMLSHTNITEPVPGRFQRFNKTLQAFPIQYVTAVGLGAESLLARKTLSLGVQGWLPDDQWQREMTARWATALAGLQAFFVQTAAGVTFPGLEKYRGYEPVEDFEKDMCKNQASLLTSCHQEPLNFLQPNQLMHTLFLPENHFDVSWFIFGVWPLLCLCFRRCYHNALICPRAVPAMLPPAPSQAARGPRARARRNVQGH